MEDEINVVTPKVNWDSYDPIKLREYALMSDIYTGRLSIPREAVDCRNTQCKDENHILQLKDLYDNLCKCLSYASNDVLGVNKIKKYNCKPGFNEHVKELHDIARKRFMAWREANKPRDTNNHFFKEMTISRARFKLALRFIKCHENQMRQDAIADALCEDSQGKFWKEIRKLSPNNVPLPTSIDDATV